MNFVEALETKNTFTENGAVTNSSTLNDCVNLFFTIGAMRGEDKSRLIKLFSKAFNEDSTTALRILFWVRDIRFGAGERQIFRDIMVYLAENHTDSLRKNLQYVTEFGRWDDLECLFGTKLETEALQIIVQGLRDGNGLCAKWTPRKGPIFNKIRKVFGITPKELRKKLVYGSKTVEQLMCSNNWNLIEYPKTPSLAMARYTNSFIKHDRNRFAEFIQSLKSGQSKINTGAVYPYDVLKTLKYGDKELATEQWKSLPNFMEGCTEKILPVVDVSGSMGKMISTGVNCMDVAISLGLYISERNEGEFKDLFVTFSESPVIQKLRGNLYERYLQLERADWGMSTNVEAVFDLILNTATKSNLSQADMPTKILIMSDMEFDQCSNFDLSAFEMMSAKYKDHGYDLPGIIFWNIQSRNENFPVRFDESNTALISGFSPSILKSILGGKELNPIMVMNETIQSPRYEMIKG